MGVGTTEAEAARLIWSSPLLVAVVGLFTTVLANIIQNYLQGAANRALERQRFESTLIEKAIDTGDPEEAAKRLCFLVDVGLVEDSNHKIASYVAKPESIPLRPSEPPSEMFRGAIGKAARLTVGRDTLKEYPDLADLIAALPPDATMEQRLSEGGRDANSQRLAEEERNAAVHAYLYHYRRLLSNDFQLVIGRKPGVSPEMYMFARISGLPDPANPNYTQLSSVRESFKELVDQSP